MWKVPIALVFLVAAGPAAKAQIAKSDRWILIDSRTINAASGQEIVDTKAAAGSFKAVRLVVRDRQTDFRGITVTYANAPAFTYGRHLRLRPGQTTRPLDLRRENRFVDRVRYVYASVARATARPARVEVWGLQSKHGALAQRAGTSAVVASTGSLAPVSKPQDPPPRPIAGGDVLFGARNLEFAVDRDVIKIADRYGKFDKIRLRALGASMAVSELRVLYAEGEPDVLAVDAGMSANGYSRWFDLKGERFIEEIRLVYSGRHGFKGQARVEVYGEFTEGWYRPSDGAGVFASANDGWLFIGGETPRPADPKKKHAHETELVSVARNGGFGKLRLDLREGRIALRQLSIEYDDGSVDAVSIKKVIEAGGSYGPIELKPKAIKQIKLSYRANNLGKHRGNPFLEFWAQ